jgi:hypothetical protein
MPLTVYPSLDAVLTHVDPELQSEAQVQFERWLNRGDGIAVYENVDLGHRELGHRQWISYGSPEAQLEVDTPPRILPDIGARINWRYALEGVYRPDESVVALKVESLYAHHAGDLSPTSRATLANAVKILREIALNGEVRP